MTIYTFIQRHFLRLAAFCFFCTPVSAQTIYDVESPYEVSIRRDLPIFLIGGAGLITSFVMEENIELFDQNDIDALDRNDIRFEFDRKVVDNNSKAADVASDIFLGSSFVYPLAFAVDRRTRSGYLQIGILATESFLINGAMTSLTKVIAKRARPFTYNPDFHSPADKEEVTARLSFYSGHTSVVSTLSFFCAKVFHDYHPNSNWKALVWSSAVTIPAVTGYLRVRAGKHFPTDVITGYVLGGAIGILVPQLHKKKKKDSKVSFTPIGGGDSVGVLMTW